MRTKSQAIVAVVAVVAAVLIVLFTTGGTTAQKSKAKEETRQPNITTLELAISKDGRAIVDQNGNIVARFVRGMRVQMTPQGVEADSLKTQGAKAGSLKIQGCFRCKKDCVVYDNKGRCVRWVNSCTWDFDCK